MRPGRTVFEALLCDPPQCSQVECLFRLLEQATAKKDATKHPPFRSVSSDFDVRTAMAGISPNKSPREMPRGEVRNPRLKPSSGVGLGSSKAQGGKGDGKPLGPPARSEASCGSPVGIEGVVVEGALLTALEVVSLLVRHEPLDDACLR